MPHLSISQGAGSGYFLNGHKWFTSAPMCDAFLTLAQVAHLVECYAILYYTILLPLDAERVVLLSCATMDSTHRRAQHRLHGCPFKGMVWYGAV